MALRKEKKEKMSIVPKQKTAAMSQRPYELRSDIDQLFDRFRSSFDELFWGPGIDLMASPDYRTPLMDIVDLGDKYEMHVEMPGIKKEDINIEVTPTMVEICAEHEETSENKGKNWLRQERSSTDFYRSLELPEELKTGNVDAELKDGVLTLSLPKAEPKPKFETTKVKIK
jgi:HSP20 family protein